MTITRRMLRLTSMSVAALALSLGALASTTATAGAASTNQFTVKATEYTYKLSGSPKPGTTQVNFDNGGVELHMMAVLPLKSGVTKKQLMTALMSDDQEQAQKEVGRGNGAPVDGLPLFLSPGQASSTIANFTAGHYGIACFVPDSDGTPHLVHGMVDVFDVKGSKSTTKPPTDGVTNVTIADSGVTLPSSGLPKSGWVKVTNNTSVTRDFSVAQFTGSDTFDQANAEFNSFFETGKFPSGSAPATIVASIGSIAPSSTGYVQVSLKPGRSVAISDNDEVDNDTNPLHAEFDAK